MGCCQAKDIQEQGQYAEEEDVYQGYTAPTINHQVKRKGNKPSQEEKRIMAAQAAEARASQWSQGGPISKNQKSLLERREKDTLLGKIEGAYRKKGHTPPIGLPTCDIAVLKRHWEQMKDV